MGLTVFKLVVAYYSGSVGVLSEGLHSLLDVVSAWVAFFTVREAGKPADDHHPFGHGKIETLSSLFEALLLIVAAGVICFEGYDHFLHPHPIRYEGLAMATMGVSLVVSYIVFRHNAKAAKATDSSALYVNALHFLSDVVASLGVMIGLIVMKLTGWLVVDAITAFAVAAYIAVLSLGQVKKALHELTDTHLPEAELEVLWKILHSFKGRAIEAHDLRTRKSGATRHIDFHLVVCGKMTVEESHGVCDEIESKIHDEFRNASVNIHVEPCETELTDCHKHCERASK